MGEITHIFVSHSHSDNAWCRAFVTALRARGADVWYDEQNLGFGTLRSTIEHEMQLRPVFITIFSPASVVSKWVGREMDAAIYLQDKQSERVILPVVAVKSDIPPLWVSFKRICGPDDGPLAPEEAAVEVARALKIVAPAPTPPALPGPLTPPGPPDAAQPGSTAEAGGYTRLLPSAAIFEHAVTDLYDRERGRPLVRYPLWLVSALAVTGFAALLVTGLYGYRDPLESSATRNVFHEAWPLYLWLCALLVVLEVSVLRHPTLRRVRVAVLVVTALGILLTGVLSFYSLEIALLLQGFVYNSFGVRVLFPWVGTSPWTYTLINFGLLALYFGYQIRLWVRRVRGLPLRAPVDDTQTPATESGAPQTSQQDPSLAELVPGSLLGGTLVCLVLAFVMQPQVINVFATLAQSNVPVSGCATVWPLGACLRGGGGPVVAPSLTFLDKELALVFTLMALLLIAPSGVLRGLQGVSSVLPIAEPEMETNGTSGRVVGRSGFRTVLGLLRSAVGRIGFHTSLALRTFFDVRVLVFNVAWLMRFIAWPVLILLAVIALASTARRAQEHLHLLSVQVTCVSATTCGDYDVVKDEIAQGQMYMAGATAILLGVFAAVATTLALSLLLHRRVVARNTLRYLAVLALHVLLLLWLVAAALASVNGLLLLTGITFRHPFAALDPVTLLSFAATTVAGQVLLLRRIRAYYGRVR
jgi:hypothetical protein